MGMIYRRKKRDPATGKLEEQGPYWMKYYTGSAIPRSAANPPDVLGN